MHRGIIVLIIVAVLIIISYVSYEKYCHCSGMATRFDRPFTFWRGAEWPTPYEASPMFNWEMGSNHQHTGRIWTPNPGMPYSDSKCDRYSIDDNVKRDLYRDQVDGLIATGVNYSPVGDSSLAAMKMAMTNELNSGIGTRYKGNMCGSCNSGENLSSQFVPLQAIGASLPPGAVTNARPWMDSIENRMRFGDGLYNEMAPRGSWRFGGYNPMEGAIMPYGASSVGVL